MGLRVAIRGDYSVFFQPVYVLARKIATFFLLRGTRRSEFKISRDFWKIIQPEDSVGDLQIDLVSSEFTLGEFCRFLHVESTRRMLDSSKIERLSVCRIHSVVR
jgi:hypothetical protein